MFKKKGSNTAGEDAPMPTPPPPSAYTSSTVEQFEEVGDPSKESASLKGKMSIGRRRIGEKIGQKMGKEATGDQEFYDRYLKVQELCQRVTEVKDAMKSLLEATRAMSSSSLLLANMCGKVDLRDTAFQNTLGELDKSVRTISDDAISRALEGVEKKLVPMRDLDRSVTTRNNLKLDYDHYVRKVKELKEKPGSDAAKVAGNEMKLEAAKRAVHEATTSVYKRFLYYEAIGGRLIQPEVEIFKGSMATFYNTAYNTVKEMPCRPAADVQAEIDALGREAMLRPSNTGYDGSGGSFYSNSGGGGGYSNQSPGHSNRGSESMQPTSGTSAWNQSPAASPWGAPPAQPAAQPSGNTGGGGGAWWDQSSAAASLPVATPVGGMGMGGGQRIERARALYNYSAQDNTELSLVYDEVISIVDKSEGGWWMGEKGGQRGLIPANYVSLI